MKAHRKSASRKQESGKQTTWKQVVKASADDDDAPRSATQLAALARLGVTPEQLATVPAITPVLKMAHGGMKQIMSAMRFAPDPTISTFLRKYDSIPAADRRSLPIEAVALVAGIDINALLGSIMLALQAQAVNAVKLIALSGHPKIAAARLRFGQMPSGERDRTALDTALGLLPSPRGGAVFIGKAVYGSGQSTMRQQRHLSGEPVSDDEDETDEVPIAAARDDEGWETDPQKIDLDKLFPPANIMQEKLVAIRNRLPQDTAAPSAATINRLFRKN